MVIPTKPKRPWHLPEFKPEAGERVIWRGKPVLESFYHLFLLGFLAVLFGLGVLVIHPSATTALLAVITVIFCVGVVALAEAVRRSRTYLVTVRRIRYERRLLSTSAREIPLGSVTNVSAGQDAVGRVLNFGYVLLETPAAGVILFAGVRDPYAVSDLIRKVVREHAPKSRFW